MKRYTLALLCIALASCTTPKGSSASLSLRDPTKPDLSVVHLAGTITQMPANSKWPASIKVGAAHHSTSSSELVWL